MPIVPLTVRGGYPAKPAHWQQTRSARQTCCRPASAPMPSPSSVRPARHALRTCLLAVGLPLLAARTAGAQIAVVVNSSNSIDDLSLDRLRRLFLGQASTFPSGGHARLATHLGSTELFDRRALGLQAEVVRSRWMAIVFRGESTGVPANFASIEEVKSFVREHPDAIAFLPASAVDGSLKILRIDGQRPADSGYPIR